MWYEESLCGLDYSKPIVAEETNGNKKYLLLPQIDKVYTLLGYNWFNVGTGVYQSSACFGSPQEAIQTYEGHGHVVYNVDILLTKAS